MLAASRSSDRLPDHPVAVRCSDAIRPPLRRRPADRGPTHGFLPAVAGIVDQATVDEPGHVLVHVDGPVHPEV